jgi:hypothetical protein
LAIFFTLFFAFSVVFISRIFIFLSYQVCFISSRHVPKHSASIAHNVLAVYEVLGTEISKNKGNPFLSAFIFAGAQNLGE